MLFSIVIASKDRASKLQKCLGSIPMDDMVSTGSELIVVDNGSKDKSLDIIKAFQARAPFDVHCLLEKQKGLSFCRNRGIKQAKGRIIIFTDDDCYLDKSYLKAAAGIFENKDIGFATGRVLLYDKTDCPIMTCSDTTPRIIDSKSLVGVPKIIGANMIIRRSVIERVGFFDIRFGSGTRFVVDDIDYISRVLINGNVGVFDPRLIVYHHHGRKSEKDIQNQEKRYARGIGAHYCKRTLNHDASALNALLFAISRDHTFSLFKLPQADYKEEMLQGALEYLRLCVNPRQEN